MSNPEISRNESLRVLPQNEEFNFSSFAEDGAYQEENRQLLETGLSFLPDHFTHLDMATGTGLVPTLTNQLCKQTGKRGSFIGVDPDQYAVSIANQNSPESDYYSGASYVGKAQDLGRILAPLDLSLHSFDFVTMHDAIHEVPNNEKQEVIDILAEVLKPNGVVSMNSTFTSVAQAGLEYGIWILRAHKLAGISPEKAALTIQSPDDYKAMLEKAGLTIKVDEIVSVALSKDAIKGISQYPRFILETFPFIDPSNEQQIKTYSGYLSQAADMVKSKTFPRNWWRVIAQKS